jgi:hypothetical protein
MIIFSNYFLLKTHALNMCMYIPIFIHLITDLYLHVNKPTGKK